MPTRPRLVGNTRRVVGLTEEGNNMSSPIIRITVENAELILKHKKDGSSSYYTQSAWLHTVDQNGNPNKYPERIEFYAPKGTDGKTQVPYPVGEYFLSPKSIKVRFGRPEIGFLELEPLKPTAKTAAA